jgi:8-oxo-dGTP diphosphatase
MRTSTAALIRNGDRLLFIRRPPGGALSECWELPGGKVDAGELPEEALARELMEELRLEAEVGPCLGEASFEHAGEEFALLGFEVLPAVPVGDLLGRIELVEHQDAAFLQARDAAALELAPSDRSLLETLGLIEV